MHVRQLATSGVLLGSVGLALAMSTPAYAVCDAYSGNCPSPLPTSDTGGGGTDIGGDTEQPGSGAAGGGTGTAGGGTTSNPATLPFTGGELVLLTAVGAGALAGGTALVIAGRRRSSATA